MFSFIRTMSPEKRKMVYTLFFAFICNGLMALMIGSVIPDLKTSYGLTDSQTGIFLSAHSAGNLIAGLLSGVVPLYLGRRRSVVLQGVLAFIAFIMIMFWGNPAWLFVAFLMTGIGRGAVTNFNNQRINLISDGNPSAITFLHAGFAVGAIAAPMLFLLGQQTVGWRWGVAVMVVFGFVSMGSLGRMKVEDNYPSKGDKAHNTLAFLKNPSFLVLALMLFCYLCSEYCITGWLVTYLQNKEELLLAFGKTGSELTLALNNFSQFMATLFWGVILVGRLFCAWLSGKADSKKLMVIFSAGIVAFFAMMLMSATIPMVTVAVAGLGFCMSGMSPMIIASASYFTNRYTMAIGTLSAIASFGAIFMPAAVGFTAERLGFGGGMSVIYSTILLLLVGSIIHLVMKPCFPVQPKGEKA